MYPTLFFTCCVITVVGKAMTSTINCMECIDQVYPRDCGVTTTCSEHESCHVTEKVTPSGHIVYDSGCMAEHICNAISQRSIRDLIPSARDVRTEQSHVEYDDVIKKRADIETCIECCRDKEYCNINGCGQTVVSPPSRGLYCFHCTRQDAEDHCRDVIQCDINESCLLVNMTYLGRQLYSSMCATEPACATLASSHHRRRGLDDVMGEIYDVKKVAIEMMSTELYESLAKLSNGIVDPDLLNIQQIQDGEYENDNISEESDKKEIKTNENNTGINKDGGGNLKLVHSREATMDNYLKSRETNLTGMDICPYCCASDFCNVNCIH